jgi:excisionase family DNA binding protein
VSIDVDAQGRLLPAVQSDATVGSLTEADVIQIVHRALDLYTARHPRPTQVNMKQAAEMLGVSQPTVRKIMHSGRLRFNKCGLIPIEQVDKLLAVTE